MDTNNERDEMPRHNYDDNIEDVNVEKSYAFYNQPKNTMEAYTGITKGKWTINHFMNEFSIYDADNKMGICKIPFGGGERNLTEAQAEANAQAIANLPELIKENERLKELFSKADKTAFQLKSENEQLRASNQLLLDALKPILMAYELLRKSDLRFKGYQYMEDSQTIAAKEALKKSTTQQ